jgi:EpsI family protein
MLSTGALVLTAFALARIGGARTSWRDTLSFDLVAAAAPQEIQPTAKPEQRVPTPFFAAAALIFVGAGMDMVTPPPQTVVPTRTSLYDFPTQLGDWVGRRESLQSIYLDALHLDDYTLTDFRGPDGQIINFYAAYYESQDNTRAIHSPHDCIPGGGWEITRFEQRPFPASGSTPSFQFNRAIVQLGTRRQIVYYWFQERGRHFTSEYAARWYLFWDALTRHRTDGALIRFVAALPPDANEADVDARIMRLATRIEPALSSYVPD